VGRFLEIRRVKGVSAPKGTARQFMQLEYPFLPPLQSSRERRLPLGRQFVKQVCQGEDVLVPTVERERVGIGAEGERMTASEAPQCSPFRRIAARRRTSRHVPQEPMLGKMLHPN
jgi:hypothetical protein